MTDKRLTDIDGWCERNLISRAYLARRANVDVTTLYRRSRRTCAKRAWCRVNAALTSAMNEIEMDRACYARAE